MAEERALLTGMRFSRWTVLEENYRDEKGYRRWKCRCDCGTEKFVLERSLKSGASQSCGCATREAVRATGQDLLGRTFGRLTVRERLAGRPVKWRCSCNCGGECVATTKALVSGRRWHCGCVPRKGAHVKDIRGKRFTMLTAICPTDRRDARGSVIWRCKCDCGREVEVSCDTLEYGGVTSCGCRRERCAQLLSSHLTHVADTSIDALRSKKRRRDNSTGCTGVYLKRGKYIARITMQGKDYYLGSFDKLDAAAQVRKEAEKLLHDDFVRFYDQWKQRADADPQWAEENPVSIQVEAQRMGDFSVVMLPHMD